MRYVFNKSMPVKSSRVLQFLAMSGWVLFILTILSCYIAQKYGSQLW